MCIELSAESQAVNRNQCKSQQRPSFHPSVAQSLCRLQPQIAFQILKQSFRDRRSFGLENKSLMVLEDSGKLRLGSLIRAWLGCTFSLIADLEASRSPNDAFEVYLSLLHSFTMAPRSLKQPRINWISSRKLQANCPMGKWASVIGKVWGKTASPPAS